MKGEEIDLMDQIGMVMDITLRLTEIGIANKKEPQEIVDYFIKITDAFLARMKEVGKALEG